MPAVYGVVSLLLVIAVVAVAYGTQAPSLGVAEFAPAARQTVEPPPTTAGNTDSGEPGGGRSSRTTAPPATAAPPAADPSAGSVSTTVVTRARSCVGNPPRQTEDPQSPPCIATMFEGDNGGATASGVTGTDISIAVPLTSDDANTKAVVEAQFEYFNQRYEFYGRRLKPVFVVGGASDAVTSRSFAADLASRGVFGALTFQIEGTNQPHLAFYQEAARQGMVTVATDTTRLMTDATVYDTYHPYIWSVYASVEQRYRAAGSLVCTALADRPARHAGTGALRETTRRFAIIASADQSIPSTRQLEELIGDCAPLATTVKLSSADMNGGGVRTSLEKLKADGVTTILCVCGGSAFPSNYLGDAASLSYFPEWMPIFYYASDEYWGNFISPTATYDQLTNVILMTGFNKVMPQQSRPSFTAVMAIRPDLFRTAVSTVMGAGDRLYKQMQVITAGIQGAGPTLTPDTFGTALMSMKFPNPGAGAAPFWQQSVGFGPGDHSLFDDFVLAWWNRAAEVLNPAAPAGRGSWCYVNQGARYRPGTFPADADALLFDTTKPCR